MRENESSKRFLLLLLRMRDIQKKRLATRELR